VLWVLVFAAVCYPAFRATHREGAGRGSAGAGRAGAGAGREGAGSAQPWRAEVVAGVLSLVGCLLVVPLVAGGGLTAYLLAAVVVLAVYLLSAWWFG